MVCPSFWEDYYMLIYTHCWELMNSVGSHGSSSLPFMMKVMDGLSLCERLSWGYDCTHCRVTFNCCCGDFSATSSIFLLLHLILCCHQEGVTKLWTGLGPNVARNAIINAAELASYDQVKQVNINIYKFPVFKFSTLWDSSRGPCTSWCTFFAAAKLGHLVGVPAHLWLSWQTVQTLLKLPGFSDNVITHLLSGLGAGFIAVCVGSPVDVVCCQHLLLWWIFSLSCIGASASFTVTVCISRMFIFAAYL
jgi:hypothetical protein